MTKSKVIPFYTAYGTKKVNNFNTIGPSLTDPQYKDDNNVNYFIKRYHQTGEIPNFKGTLQYGDFTHVGSYQDALNRVIEAKEKFMEFPSRIREQFNNDPNQFFNWVNNPDNNEEIKELFGENSSDSSVPPVESEEVPSADLDTKNPKPTTAQHIDT